MKDIIRDSTLGQLVNYISAGRFLPYADQKPSYDIPAHYLLPPSTSKPSPTDEKENPLGAELTIPVDTPHPHRASGGSVTRINTPVPQDSSVGDHEKGDVKTEVVTYDPYLVGWDGDDDPENPRYVNACQLHLFKFFPKATCNFSLFLQKLVLGETVLRDVLNQLTHIQRVHRIRNLYPRHSRAHESVWSLPHEGHTRAHTLRSR